MLLLQPLLLRKMYLKSTLKYVVISPAWLTNLIKKLKFLEFSFQDNFQHMGDLTFIVYFDFETTTGDSVTDDKKMFVVSYCQIYAFHPSLNLEKVVTFRSFQQNFEEVNSLDHFAQDHFCFFDPVTIKQMRDAALSGLAKEKTTPLSETFLVELKFTIDTLIKWFHATFKSRFLELSDFSKRAFLERSPLDFSKPTCSNCGFMLSVSAREGPEKTLNLMTWYDFTVQQEYLFLKNIYNAEDFEKIENLKTLEDFYDVFEYFTETVVLLKGENYLRTDCEQQEKIREFFEIYCSNCNDGSEVVEQIDNLKIVQTCDASPQKKNSHFCKLVGFVYERVMNFMTLTVQRDQ